ncbi:MAG: insulinase family protein, partial [Gemmatimonadetes bacterium]|nr:insulinase family protein [Gemmatimonadota bacterium]NIU72977.1 insulinase family protein [Gammaproteobacteria bacterium]NIV54642.1 insulinase family protein [Actinomycetota bacterium]NIQ52847.1 insulinase family protein [Gemmatimonadota bacterium]NIX43332.1 insulinase family protein [Gemmatimonadota bacterium]
TSREHTAYQARVLDEHTPEALDVLADLVLAPRLDEADLELEREVIL